MHLRNLPIEWLQRCESIFSSIIHISMLFVKLSSHQFDYILPATAIPSRADKIRGRIAILGLLR